MMWEKRTHGKRSVVQVLHLKTATAPCELYERNVLNIKCVFLNKIVLIFCMWTWKKSNLNG